jgi:hypothetical protein
MICKVAKRKNNYGVVTAEVMLNTALSSDARFLLAMVSVLPPDWKFFIHWLRKQSRWGKDKLQKVMRELEQNGHLTRKRNMPSQGDNPARIAWEYTFILEPDFQALENQATENQANRTNSMKPVVLPPSSQDSQKKKSGRTTTNQPSNGGDGGSRASSASQKEKRRTAPDSPLVDAIKRFLVKECDGPWTMESPMIGRTARCLASRANSIEEFQALYQSEINVICEYATTLNDVREMFGLGRDGEY